MNQAIAATRKRRPAFTNMATKRVPRPKTMPVMG
jgi:hypothetical protein